VILGIDYFFIFRPFRPFFFFCVPTGYGIGNNNEADTSENKALRDGRLDRLEKEKK
jgi:hypothetical protein